MAALDAREELAQHRRRKIRPAGSGGDAPASMTVSPREQRSDGDGDEPSGEAPRSRTFPKYVTRTMASVASPAIGCSNVWNTKSIEMKPIAMPASVERSAARGVARRTTSATGARTSSIIPEASVATRAIVNRRR